jgi:hypothetical protein
LEDPVTKGSDTNRILRLTVLCFLLAAMMAATAFAQDVSSSPTSLAFNNEYVGLQSGSKTLTISNLLSGDAIIQAVSFSCPGYGLASGVAPFTLTNGPPDPITHYSVWFRPTTAGTYNCNFVISMWDGTDVFVPLTGTGVTTTATTTVTPSSLTFPNQSVGVASAPQNVTVTNSGGSSVNITAITTSPADFTIGPVTLPYTLAKAGGTLVIPVYYNPNRVGSEIGAIDITYNNLPDQGASLSGTGVAATSLEIASSPILPIATQTAAYEQTFTATGSGGPFTWALASGSTLPSGLTLSSTGTLSGTLASSVTAGTYTFTVQVTDTTSHKTASTLFTLSVFANLGDNCNDLSYNDPNAGTPLVAISDLGTGTFEGYEGGLYPNGSNVRPSSHDSDGVTFAKAIQPLDSNGNPSPNGVYVLMALGESTIQNEFNRFLPIANSDPAKNPKLVIVNGAQGGATPNDFANINSYYWGMVLNNYLPQNGVTAKQVVAVDIEDTDGIATGTFPSDITNLQSEYESMMNNLHTLFPNLTLVYFSSRVYGGYSNGVGTPDNPEPYAYEVGWAVKWAIQDQLNGNANLNYNPLLGAVEAPWMSWGTYYWANGMLGRADGLEWDCADFSADGTHPASTTGRLGQLKVASQILTFLKTDDTTIPWYLAATLALTPTGGNNQTGTVGVQLPQPLTVLASNLNTGSPISGVSVTFSDGGKGGTFGTPTAITGSNGQASTTYTPSSSGTITITAAAAGYASATFTETVNGTTKTLAVNAGNNQTGQVSTTLPTALAVLATNNGSPVSGLSVTFNDGGAGGTFGTPTAITGSNGIASSTYTLPSTAKTETITASATGYTSTTFTETSTPAVATITTVSGGKQSGVVGTTLPLPIVVKAKNSSGAIVVGAPITFADGGIGGTFSPNPAITGSNGQASTTFTLPTVTKIMTVTATDSPATVNITETSTAGPATALTIVQGNNQSANPNNLLPKKLIVKVADKYGNGISGVTVTFTDNGAGGTFSPNSTPVTTSNGQASVSYTTGSNAGTITISASTSTLGPVNFTETVK